ncbi:MAG: Calcium-gated potassium channel mthK [Marmoricola sp.]|nr:Calcium-gated potassium channel mthK [Marmoricola sp.]
MSSLTADQGALASWQDHVIVCGLHDEGVRVVEQLHRAGVAVIVVDDVPDIRLVRRLDDLGVPYVRADSRLTETLHSAGLDGAAAVICVESDDLHTLATALLARELSATVRVVVQFRNAAVGRALTGVGVAVLDVARLAAPSVVDACLGTKVRTVRLGEEDFVVTETVAVIGGTLRELYGDLAPLAVVPADGSDVITTPGRDLALVPGDTAILVGGAAATAAAGLGPRSPAREAAFIGARAGRARERNQRSALIATIARSLDRRLKLALLSLLGLVTVSICVLMAGYREPDGTRMSVVDALYFTVETIGTVGFGDFYFRDQVLWLRVWAIVLMLVGATLATLFFALLTNMLISRRIAESLGLRRITGLRDHVIVVGAGSIGLAVADELLARQVAVVAVEADEDNRFLEHLRQRDVPLVTADATLPETLRAAQIDRARAIAVVTSSDLVNIEAGLAMRDLLGERWPDVPVVLRIFDGRLARTVTAGFDFRHVRSPAALAAPWFVGAALGLDIRDTFYVAGQPVLVARLAVAAGDRLDGLAMRDLPARVRVVSLTRATGVVDHLPRRDTCFAAGDAAYVIGPYAELLQLLRAVSSSAS